MRGVVRHQLDRELFHLDDDPVQAINLFEQQPEVAAELEALLEKYEREGRSTPAATGG